MVRKLEPVVISVELDGKVMLFALHDQASRTVGYAQVCFHPAGINIQVLSDQSAPVSITLSEELTGKLFYQWCKAEAKLCESCHQKQYTVPPRLCRKCGRSYCDTCFPTHVCEPPPEF